MCYGFILQSVQVSLTIQQQLPQTPLPNELEYQAIVLTHTLVRFEDDWLSQNIQLVSLLTVNSQVKINKKFQHKIVNIFLPIIFNICFGCSKEPSH